MITLNRRTAAMLLILTFLGCKSAHPTSAASIEPVADANSSAGEAGRVQAVAITDPTLSNMTAFSITIPAKWHFQGVLYQGGSCVQTPSGVYRSTSPDGLSKVEAMPPMGWIWGTGPRAQAKSDCLPMKGPMAAQDFLKYYAGTLNVAYVSADPVPDSVNAKVQEDFRRAEASLAAQYAASHLQAPKQTVELARALVSFKNGTFAMKGLLKTKVTCTETSYAGMKSILRGMADVPPSIVNQCVAYVGYFTAPENQFASMMRQWEAPGMGSNGGDKEWFQVYLKRMQDQSNEMIAQSNRMAQQRLQQNAAQFSQLQSRAQQFQHDQAVRQQMHEQFLSTMQRGTDRSMAATAASMNARSTAASDIVDYALDRQTVSDPTTGQVSKVSSSYTQTWIDSTGKYSYQTNDLNANPNGVLSGTWTQQQKVHGNGTPQ
jgi:hypothetical protein